MVVCLTVHKNKKEIKMSEQPTATVDVAARDIADRQGFELARRKAFAIAEEIGRTALFTELAGSTLLRGKRGKAGDTVLDLAYDALTADEAPGPHNAKDLYQLRVTSDGDVVDITRHTHLNPRTQAAIEKKRQGLKRIPSAKPRNYTSMIHAVG
jgi:hypothetical protein